MVLSIRSVRIRLLVFVGLVGALPATSLWGQTHPDTVFTLVRFGRTMKATVVNGDTVPWAVLDEVMVGDKPVFTSAEARKKYYQLKRKVIKVYPYAVTAGNKLDSLNLKLDGLKNNRQRNKAIKEYQDFLEKRFEPELRKLTRSEGQVLAKLIQRETGMTVFHLIREYRNTLTAWTWAATGAWYDISIREKYDPAANEDDKLVEAILRRAFAEGALQPRKRFYTGKAGKKR